MIKNKRLSLVSSDKRSTPSWLSQRKGTHVGVIISFGVFIVFLVFLFLILEPSLKVNEGKEETLENMGTLFISYLDSELTTVSIQINQDIGSCVDFSGVDFIPSGLNNNNIFVKNSTNANMKFDWLADTSHLLVENNGQNRFFKIYASTGINSQENVPSGCQAPTSYTLGNVKTENNIFERDIIDAISLYKINFALLRQNVGITTDEFGFDFIYSNGTLVGTGEKSENKNVFAKEIPINYLDEDLNSNAGSIIIKTW